MYLIIMKEYYFLNSTKVIHDTILYTIIYDKILNGLKLLISIIMKIIMYVVYYYYVVLKHKTA